MGFLSNPITWLFSVVIWGVEGIWSLMQAAIAMLIQFGFDIFVWFLSMLMELVPDAFVDTINGYIDTISPIAGPIGAGVRIGLWAADQVVDVRLYFTILLWYIILTLFAWWWGAVWWLIHKVWGSASETA